ncbi:putative phosphate ABC transporter, ATP-binding protein [Rhizoctonia solani 123E]|uniref:Putative phosphate ABC transporter, ATP-binding protein n=1 Tax=Rhizoctonia solani 123E TaxID=1423351 RepID=A0A074RZ55_9AGAM|nr:putative phosphate ABC transporter, ATP-binding protein [Rhizoctonia solani 123E]
MTVLTSPLEDATTLTTLTKLDSHLSDVDSVKSGSETDETDKLKRENNGSDRPKPVPQSKPLFREEQRGIWTLYYTVSEGWKVPLPTLVYEWNTGKIKSALRDLWRFIREVFSLGPLALTIYFASWIVSSILPSLRLKNDSDLLNLAEKALAGRIQRTEAITEFRRIVIEYVVALVVGYVVRKLKTRSSSIVERRVALHFDTKLLSVRSRLELGPTEDPAIESKISRVTGYSSEAWSSLSSIIDILSSTGEVIAIASILKGQLISPEGVNLFGIWALISPLVSELHGHGDGKVFYAKITNQNWIRMEAFSQLGNWNCYKKEILSSGLEEYINSEYARAMSKLGDLTTKNPAYVWSSDEGWFGLGEFSQLLDTVPLLFCTWSAVHSSSGASLAAMIRTQQTSSAARSAIWSLLFKGRDLFSLFRTITTLYEVLQMKPGIEDGHVIYPDEEHTDQKGMAIEFKGVSFGYPSAPNKALNNLSFKIEPGQLCVIVGENGCGKSTTINLINRLYDCNSGEIYIDGRPIRDYKVSTLRAAGNIMYQDYHHFPFTIKENILMGRPDSENPDIDIENAAKLGGAYDFIQKLPLGLETNLEPKSTGYASIACGESDQEKFKSIGEIEKPVKLSGGEWQRLAISRTYMKNSEKTRLLCYDEPSASLDPKAEADMFERLRNLRGEKTMIFVTHRFGHLTKHADLIIYISEGSVIEQGTHKSLLAQGGEYAKMYNIQSEAFTARSRGVAAALLAVSVGSASYVAGSLYPPTTLQLINPPPAPPAPTFGTQEAEIYTAALEENLQNLPLTKELRQRQGWYESRPYQNYPEERRRHSLTSGTLRGPGKLALPPLVFAKEDESEAIVIIHVGRSLCGHDGIVHGGLLATLLDETLARNAILNLPSKVGVTANLSVNYRAPARADQFITIHTRLDKANGRKVTVSGTIASVETKEVLTEATALFIQPKYAHLLNVHGEVEKLLGARNNTTSQEVGPDGAKKQVKVPQEAAV